MGGVQKIMGTAVMPSQVASGLCRDLWLRKHQVDSLPGEYVEVWITGVKAKDW